MYRQHFGLTQEPLGKDAKSLWDDGQLKELMASFEWLLNHPGLGLLTGDPGVGKTAALRYIVTTLNPHQYSIIYISETDFGRLDLYRQIAIAMGIEPAHRRAQLWRDIKHYIEELVTHKNVLPVIIIDEAHNLPKDFFRDLPSFMNFSFDSKDMMVIWLVGNLSLSHMLSRNIYSAVYSRISVKHVWSPIQENDRFSQMVTYALKDSGIQSQIISDSGMNMLCMASQGNPRIANKILITALQFAAYRGINHLPDDILKTAITSLQNKSS